MAVPSLLCFPAHVKELVMKAKVVEDADVVTYVVVCDPGDEAVSAPAQFARSVFPTLEAVVTETPRGCARYCAPISGSRSSIWTGPSRDQRKETP
jgi:hypothetical protein